MPKDLTWENAEDIGILLSEKHPDVDPLAVRFTDLHAYVTQLAEFKDDPKKSNEASSRPSRWRGTRSFWTARRASSPSECLSGSCAFFHLFIKLLQDIKRLLVLARV